jgi:primosomal protein N' (replication factor Y)
VFAFLDRLRHEAGPEPPGLIMLGPTADWMERRDGRYRAQLLLQSAARAPLHELIERSLLALRGWRESRRVRWAIDVDPIEL